MTCLCPTCRQPIQEPRLPVEGLLDLKLAPQQREILAAIIKAYPRRVHTDRILNEVYSERIDGGPLTAVAVVKSQLTQIRKAIAPYGWKIPAGRASSRGSEYRLEAITA